MQISEIIAELLRKPAPPRDNPYIDDRTASANRYLEKLNHLAAVLQARAVRICGDNWDRAPTVKVIKAGLGPKGRRRDNLVKILYTVDNGRGNTDTASYLVKFDVPVPIVAAREAGNIQSACNRQMAANGLGAVTSKRQITMDAFTAKMLALTGEDPQEACLVLAALDSGTRTTANTVYPAMPPGVTFLFCMPDLRLFARAEILKDKISVQGDILYIDNMPIPETIISSLTGMPLRSLIEHPLLPSGAIISSAATRETDLGEGYVIQFGTDVTFDDLAEPELAMAA